MTDEKRSQESSLEKLRDELAVEYRRPKWPRKGDHDRQNRYDSMMFYEIGDEVEQAYVDGFDAGVKASAHASEHASKVSVASEPIRVIADITLKPGDYVDQPTSPTPPSGGSAQFGPMASDEQIIGNFQRRVGEISKELEKWKAWAIEARETLDSYVHCHLKPDESFEDMKELLAKFPGGEDG